MKIKKPERLSQEELYTLLKQMKPVVSYEGRLWEVDIPKLPYPYKNDISGDAAYLWDVDLKSDHSYPRFNGPYTCFKNIVTYHEYAFKGFFKPTLNAVLVQIKESLSSDELKKVAAFEVLLVEEKPSPAFFEELNEGYHVAITKLYKLRSIDSMGWKDDD